MNIDQQTATLVAAAVAATATLANLVVTVWFKRTGEMQAAQRKSLEPFIEPLGEALHEIVATSKILIKTRSETGADNWKNRSQSAKTKLHDLLPKMYYPLYGITDGLRTLSRLPDWVEHARVKFPKNAVERFNSGKMLSVTIDRVICDCYRSGKTPSWLDRLRVRYRCWRFQAVYQKTQKTKDDFGAENKKD